MLVAQKLGKRYGARAVFRDVDFVVERGTVAAVVGANGAGKSTLLKIVAGLVRASAGAVLWHEDAGDQKHEIAGADLQWLCGLSAPDAPVYRELTAFENIEFFARVRGRSGVGDRLATHLGKWLPRVRHNDLAGDLSSGLRTRLQLAVATLHAPLILLLDEPSANLDDAGRALLHEALDEQRRLGLALVATNDPREAEWCDTRIEL